MTSRSLYVAAIALASFARTAAGQAVAATHVAPPGRGHHVVFYDEVRQRVMVAGGNANDARRRVTVFTDLWSFDGAGWSALTSSADTLLGARVGVDAQGRVHALGGFRDSVVGNLAVLENDRWRQIGAHPSIVVSEGGFVFDQARGRFVAFGGSGSRPMSSDVWEYDGSRWTRSAAAGPSPRAMHAMVYDARRRKVVAFGGLGARTGAQSAPLFDDTWEFDGATWQQRRVAGPPPRFGAGVAYDAQRGVVLLFGGGNHERVFSDLWSWDGTSWTKLADGGPEARMMGYIAYDKRRDRTVLFGGRRRGPDPSDLGDTWEWDGVRWRRVGQPE